MSEEAYKERIKREIEERIEERMEEEKKRKGGREEGEEINAERATLVVKDYFEKVKGAEIKIAERPLIDWMDFTVNSVKEENGLFVVKCEFYENIFSQIRVKYMVKVSKKGEIKEVSKEENG